MHRTIRKAEEAVGPGGTVRLEHYGAEIGPYQVSPDTLTETIPARPARPLTEVLSVLYRHLGSVGMKRNDTVLEAGGEMIAGVAEELERGNPAMIANDPVQVKILPAQRTVFKYHEELGHDCLGEQTTSIMVSISGAGKTRARRAEGAVRRAFRELPEIIPEVI